MSITDVMMPYSRWHTAHYVPVGLPSSPFVLDPCLPPPLYVDIDIIEASSSQSYPCSGCVGSALVGHPLLGYVVSYTLHNLCCGLKSLECGAMDRHPRASVSTLGTSPDKMENRPSSPLRTSAVNMASSGEIQGASIDLRASEASVTPRSWIPESQPRLRNSLSPYRISDFEVHRILGIGTSGRVYLVRSKYNLLFYVIKVLSKRKFVEEGRTSHARNERALLHAVDHPLIIKLWGAFQDTANLYMLHRFPEPTAKFYAAEVALALNYLHSLDIIYRDLKPENILINRDGHIKLADFGFAKSCNTVTYTFCGTSEYMAPEIVRQAPYNKSVDWYALGVLVFEMLSGHTPFFEPNIRLDALYEKIQRGISLILWPPHLSLHAIDLILKLMDRDPSRRYGNLRHGAGDVFAHSWFAEVNWVKMARLEYPVPYVPALRHLGDTSAFKPFADDNVSISHGQPLENQHIDYFPDFDYTSM
ncbi:hypothetical protein NM688_g5527 [Phlebia brevispora]|uniref:Uncharacterized protein n=1 Tax=Phlebia brevispora TaxID=194682 RepID=A0ACC1STZ1_9APHY|nr:hypothetical protein NM688_g5527 [Phlebia brevispora]